MEFQKYDVEVPGRPGEFVRHYWSGVNAPAFGPDGRVVLITHIGEEVTDRLDRFLSTLEAAAASRGIAGGSDGLAGTS